MTIPHPVPGKHGGTLARFPKAGQKGRRYDFARWAATLKHLQMYQPGNVQGIRKARKMLTRTGF